MSPVIIEVVSRSDNLSKLRQNKAEAFVRIFCHRANEAFFSREWNSSLGISIFAEALINAIIQRVKNFIYKSLSRLHNFMLRSQTTMPSDKRLEQIEN